MYAGAVTGWPTLLDGGKLLVVRLGRVHRTLSWALAGGGLGLTRAVVWQHVDALGPDDDPRALLQASLRAHGLDGAVGMMTARTLATFDCVTQTRDDVSARAVATVGLGNALAAGDPPGTMRVGTINVLVQLSRALDEGGLAEALALAAEARTAAVLAARVPSRRSAEPATGTGTDCIVVAAPEEGAPLGWVGKHTAAGCVIGGAVREAVARGVRRWIGERSEATRGANCEAVPRSLPATIGERSEATRGANCEAVPRSLPATIGERSEATRGANCEAVPRSLPATVGEVARSVQARVGT